jgi:molybdopterin-guanine dinucleotide biosynthesis protein
LSAKDLQKRRELEAELEAVIERIDRQIDIALVNLFKALEKIKYEQQ